MAREPEFLFPGPTLARSSLSCPSALTTRRPDCPASRLLATNLPAANHRALTVPTVRPALIDRGKIPRALPESPSRRHRYSGWLADHGSRKAADTARSIGDGAALSKRAPAPPRTAAVRPLALPDAGLAPRLWACRPDHRHSPAHRTAPGFATPSTRRQRASGAGCHQSRTPATDTSPVQRSHGCLPRFPPVSARARTGPRYEHCGAHCTRHSARRRRLIPRRSALPGCSPHMHAA